jgi:CheY-like chemotaxis protein
MLPSLPRIPSSVLRQRDVRIIVHGRGSRYRVHTYGRCLKQEIEATAALARDVRAAIGRAERNAAAVVRLGSVRRILIVDDEPALREILAAVLADEGYAVQTAPDGRSALDLIAAAPPDLVITDISMPRLDGWGLLTQIRQDDPTLPVLLISAIRPTLTGCLAPATDQTAFLAKPFDLEDLLDFVTRLIASRQG